MSRPHLQLQPRDLDILDALHTWGPLNADAIARGWFPCRAKANRRMSRLVQAGHCRQMLISRHEPAIYHIGPFTAQTQHRAAVNGVRVELWSTGNLVDFEPEVEFVGSDHRADALVTWGPSHAVPVTFFLEVDRSTETGAQIRQKVLGYRAYFTSLRWQRRWQRYPPIVWVAEPTRLERLERWLDGRLPSGMTCLYGLNALTTLCAGAVS